MKDVSWYANFTILIDGEDARWEDLDEASQEHILNEVKDGNCCGMFTAEGGEDNE